MADFQLGTIFVIPTSQTALPTPGSFTYDLTPGQVGVFTNTYVATATPSTAPYFYVAQGRTNNYLLGSKRSDKIKACSSSYPCNSNVTDWYKVCGCPTPVNQITQLSGWNLKCGDILTITLRAHSSYIDTLYFNGFTRSVTVQAPCCECDGDPCTEVDCDTMLDLIMEKLTGYNVTSGVIDWTSPLSYAEMGNTQEYFDLNTYFTFSKVTVGEDTCVLQIEGKPVNKYGVPCDIAAFPHEYDRMWFRVFAYEGPATTADFIVSDACNIVATETQVQSSTYARGTYEEIRQMEINYHTYQAGYLKHSYRMAGYNQNLELWAESGKTYDTYYIKFNEFDKSAYNWGDYVERDNMVIIAVESGSAMATALENALENALGTVTCDSSTGPCITTTTTTAAPTTTTTTTGVQ